MTGPAGGRGDGGPDDDSARAGGRFGATGPVHEDGPAGEYDEDDRRWPDAGDDRRWPDHDEDGRRWPDDEDSPGPGGTTGATGPDGITGTTGPGSPDGTGSPGGGSHTTWSEVSMRRFRALPIRSRMALLVGAAVAIAVTAVAVASWLLTSSQLQDELDTSLHNTQPPNSQVVAALNSCRTGGDGAGPNEKNFEYSQIVFANGQRCVVSYSQPVKVTSADVDVAKQIANGIDGRFPGTTHDSTTDSGEQVRVNTRVQNLPGWGPAAVSVSRPLHEIQASQNRMALLLTVLAGIGVVGAGAAGLWVARTGLRPVDGLTRAVEHVARTEDLSVRIPVDGEDEIARLSRSFNSMTAALASSRERQSQLIADAGHELRTPLTSLRTNIELLARSEETGRAIPPADRRALMESVKAQMSELAALIGDLQELSRPDALAPGQVQVVALHEVVEHALRRARLRGPGLVIDATTATWYVRAEPATLERAVVNVLDNAVKFSPPGGTVEVRLDAHGELTVRDHGPGIPAEDLPHVFERFWRSPSARSLPGSGLGLAIVARTLQQAGGEITLRPADGGGTVARIILPGAPTPPPGFPAEA